MKLFKYKVFSAIIVGGMLLSSCANRTYQQANLLYQNKEYSNATKKYEILTEAEKEKFDVYRELADCYYNTFQYGDAQKWYGEAIKKHAQQSDLYYQMALVMKLNNNCLEGKTYLEKYIAAEHKSGNDVLISNDFCNEKMPLEDLYGVEKIKFSQGNDYLNPTSYQDRLYFLSKLDESSGYKICSVKESDNSDFQQLQGDFVGQYPVGPFSFDNTDNSLYFTRRRMDMDEFVIDENYNVQLEILQAKKVGNQWVVSKPFDFNHNKYSFGHPAISADGKFIVFASDREGALGETDLFMCKKSKSGTWGEPKIMPAHINSKHKEITPSFSYNNNKEDSYLLSFASNRPSTKGGMDVYAVSFDGTNWGELINFDYPLNSSKNEYSLVYNNLTNETMVVSDRGGNSINDELYNFSVSNSVVGVLRDKEQNAIKDQQLTITNIGTNESQTTVTDKYGKYVAKLIQGNSYKIAFESDSYEPLLMELNSQKNIIPVIYELNLEAIALDPIDVVMEEVYFAYNSAKIDEKNSHDLLKLWNTLKEYENINITITGHTDSRGRDTYNQSLSERRAKSVNNWLIKKGVDTNRLSFEGKGETELVNKCKDGVPCSDELHKQNRRTTFTVNVPEVVEN
ncbi:MAG: outer membrane protein OmpA-like peptidoglycan-associated protein [Flavobacteriales bacterium]|jgi:outer membrane protein OmpA-like peptidoglycan-associated protein/tetratricopeptide (TPR) repeat protein